MLSINVLLLIVLLIGLVFSCLAIYHTHKAQEHLKTARKYLNEAIKFWELTRKP